MTIIADAAKVDPTPFYAAFAPLCFSLLGLWLIVVQTRYSDWRRSPVHRRRAYTLSVNLALPGMMALIALVNPGNETFWRVGFALAAVAGAGILGWMSMRGGGRSAHSVVPAVTEWLVVILYAAILVLALAPGIVNQPDGSLTALQVEEILLSVLVFVAISVAAIMMFDEPEPDAGDRRPEVR